MREVLHCSAVSTCWSGGGATGEYTLSTALCVVSAKAMGRSKPIPSDSARPATSGHVAPTVRDRGMTRAQGPRRPHGPPNALLRPGLARRLTTWCAGPNGSLDHSHQLLRSQNSENANRSLRPQAKENSRQRRRPRIPTNSESQNSSQRPQAKQNSRQRRRPRIPTNSESQNSSLRRRAKRNSREERLVRHLANPGRPLRRPLLRQGNCWTRNGVRRKRLVRRKSRLDHKGGELQVGEVSAVLWCGSLP